MAQYEHLEELVVGLYDRGELGFAKTEAEFVELRSGRMSPHFFNGRGIMSFSVDLDMPIEQQQRLARLTAEAYAFGLDQVEHDYDHIVNIPQAVNPIIGAVALLSGSSLLYLRTPEGNKGYGKHKPVEGIYNEGELVLPVDNVISKGDTKQEVTDPIGDSDLEIPGFLALVDREEGGEAALKAAGFKFTKVFGMGTATRILLDERRISRTQAEWSFEYRDRYNIPIEE